MTDAARSGEPVFVSDAAEYERRYPTSDVSTDELGAGPRAGLPLKDRDGITFGALIVAWDADADFDDGMVPTLTTVAELIAQSIARAQLADDLARDARRQGALAELAESLAGAGSLREVLDRLAEHGAEPLDGVDAVVGLIDRGGRRLRRYFADVDAGRGPQAGRDGRHVVGVPARGRGRAPATRSCSRVATSSRPSIPSCSSASTPRGSARRPTSRSATARVSSSVRSGSGGTVPVTFDPSIRVLMSTVADLAAQSIQRAWLSDERGRDAGRAGQLSRMAEALAASATVQSVADIVARDGPAVLGSVDARLDVDGGRAPAPSAPTAASARWRWRCRRSTTNGPSA